MVDPGFKTALRSILCATATGADQAKLVRKHLGCYNARLERRLGCPSSVSSEHALKREQR